MVESTVTADSKLTSSDTRRRIWAIVGASSGNLVEWFDFYVYSFCSLYFAHIFFPSGNTTTQLLQTAGVFAAGFLMRPIGGWHAATSITTCQFAVCRYSTFSHAIMSPAVIRCFCRSLLFISFGKENVIHLLRIIMQP